MSSEEIRLKALEMAERHYAGQGAPMAALLHLAQQIEWFILTGSCERPSKAPEVKEAADAAA